MRLAALSAPPLTLALTLLAAQPGAAAPAPAPSDSAPATITAQTDEDDGIPTTAPKDDYRFVAWCYGALDEYLQIYEVVKPDLKEIDKLFGTPVVEAEPYSADIAEDRKALKRFAGAIEAAEKASVHPISQQGAEAMESGRHIWAAAKMEPHRKLADAWLFWGVPAKCDRVAKTLKTRATLLGQAFAVEAPKVDAAPGAGPAPAPAPTQAAAPAQPAPAADQPSPTANSPDGGHP